MRVLAALIAFLLTAFMLCLGILVISDEWDIEINGRIIAGVLFTGLGFVSIATIFVNLTNKFMQ